MHACRSTLEDPTFDTGHTGTSNPNSAYRGQGSHALTIGDVDGDGKHEITYGAAAIDDNGTGLYSTGLGHGDALHMSDMNPDRPGQEVWMVHEEPASYGANGSEFRDARTGQLIFGLSGEGADVGRGVAMDIDPNHRGYELWSSRGGLMSANGVQISSARPSQMNFAVWWDGDLLREIEDGTAIRKWNWTTNTSSVLLAPPGVASNNSTKATPALSADILGDWREEVIWRTTDNTALRVYTTTIPAQHRIYTLMHDAQYRVAIAWQNTAYNQPPHPSFYLGDGMGAPPTPNIITSLGARVPVIAAVSDDNGASAADRVTNDATLTLSGTADAASVVTLSLDGVGVVGTTTADSSGAWAFDYTQTTLADGAHVFTAVAADSEGRNSPESAPFVVTVDTSAPAAPSITSVSGSGPLVFKGTAEAGSTVAVTRTGAGLGGTAAADASGAWTLAHAGALAQGEHGFNATATDAAGNASAPSSEFAVDTSISAPVINGVVTDTGVSPNDNVTNDTTLTLVGTAAAGHTVTVSRADLGVVGATAADSAGAWTFDYTHTTLAAGTYVFNAVASDGPGPSSLTSPDFAVTIEETAPAVVSINRFNPSTATTNVTSVVFRVTFGEPVNGVDANDFVPTTTSTAAGNIASVSAGSGTVFDVTVGSITGTGTVRLDLRDVATGISDNAGNAVAGGFTAGQSYTISSVASGQWLNPLGGAWSNTANWNGGTVANGAGSTADFGALNLTANAVVQLDFARTIGNLTFGDTATSSAASWSLVPAGGDPSNNLTLAVSSGTPTVTVGALGTGAVTNISTPLFSTAGLAKAGTGTLVLSGANVFGGPTSVSNGTLRLANGGSIQTTTMDVAATSSVLNVAGGTLTASGLVTVNAGASPAQLVIDGGVVNFNGGLRNNNNDGALIRVNGGTVTASSVTLQRGSYTTSPAYATGLVITGGTTTVNSTVGLGTNNSSSSLSVEGGTLNVNGTITVANQVTAGRGGALRVTNGTFNANDDVNGIVMSRTNGTNANNVSFATFSGGVSTVEKFTLGFDSTVNAGSATVLVNGGALYVGAGGIVRKGASGFVTNINLTSGTLGAAADWSSDLPLTLTSGGNIQLKAADASNLPQDIRLNGVLSGAGALTKTGAGALVLTNSNTYAGATHVNAGTLRVNGSVSGTGAFNVNGGGTLSGGGAVNRTVTLNSGGAVSPEANSSIAVLALSALNWNGGGQLAFDLGAASDQLTVGGAFNKGSAGAYEFVFSPAAGLAAGTTYTLVTFGTTNFAPSDFTHTGLPADVKGEFRIVGNALQFTVLDAVPPTLHVPADITLEATGPAGAVATFAATAEDNAGPVTITYSRQPGDTFPLGTTAVNVNAIDEAGNTASGTFNVNVRDTAAPSIECPPDIVAVAAPGASSAAVTFNVTGTDAVSQVTITSSPASGSAFPLGTTVVNATAKDAAGNTASCSFTVTIKSATTTTVAPAAAQYSDAVTLRAAVAAAPVAGQPLAGNVQFFVSGALIGNAPLAGGVAELTLTLTNSAAGVYDVTAKFTSANPAVYTDSDGGPAALNVSKERAAASYTGDSSLLTAGPGVTTATVRLGARLVPETDGASFVGDITKAVVTFELFKSNNLGATPDLVVGNVPVSAGGDAQTVINNLPADLYTVNVKVDAANRYWTADPSGVGVLNVVVPSDEQRTSGGGWIEDAASRDGKSNFGFNVRAGKKGEQVKGNLTFTRRGADGFNYVLKSNTWSDGYLQFAAEPGVTPEVFTRSNFRGRASLQKVDPVTGAVVASVGNYTFEVFTADGDQLTPRRADALSVTIRDAGGQLWHQLGNGRTLVTLGGGNITNKGK